MNYYIIDSMPTFLVDGVPIDSDRATQRDGATASLAAKSHQPRRQGTGAAAICNICHTVMHMGRQSAKWAEQRPAQLWRTEARAWSDGNRPWEGGGAPFDKYTCEPFAFCGDWFAQGPNREGIGAGNH